MPKRVDTSIYKNLSPIKDISQIPNAHLIVTPIMRKPPAIQNPVLPLTVQPEEPQIEISAPTSLLDMIEITYDITPQVALYATYNIAISRIITRNGSIIFDILYTHDPNVPLRQSYKLHIPSAISATLYLITHPIEAARRLIENSIPDAVPHMRRFYYLSEAECQALLSAVRQTPIYPLYNYDLVNRRPLVGNPPLYPLSTFKPNFIIKEPDKEPA